MTPAAMAKTPASMARGSIWPERSWTLRLAPPTSASAAPVNRNSCRGAQREIAPIARHSLNTAWRVGYQIRSRARLNYPHIPVTISELLRIADHLPPAGREKVQAAYERAASAHTGQRRLSGEDYVNHPLQVAAVLADLELDAATLIAALLHDTVEDTALTMKEVNEEFGPDVARLVEGVTKLGRISFRSDRQAQAENIRKMLLAMAQDIRVVLIKLADRLHNMRTLYGLPSDKQQRIARQTMEIYAPLAERLGIWQMKWELEDLAFKTLEPERFRELAKLLDTRRAGRESYIDRAIAELRPRLEAAGIEVDLQGRPKHIYSIWKKMERKS